MNEANLSLQTAIEAMLSYLASTRHTPLTVNQYRVSYARLQTFAANQGEDLYSKQLGAQFLATYGSSIQVSDRVRFKCDRRAIFYLDEFIEKGKIVTRRISTSQKPSIAKGFLEPLAKYDSAANFEWNWSKSSIVKNRRPIVYLLEFLTSLQRKNISDIRYGDTSKAIEDMLIKHYAPSSLITAITGLRRFYEMFESLHPYRNEIPRRIPRKRTIIEVLTSEEHSKLRKFVMNSDLISRRDAAIVLLCLETGLRDVDICNLKLGDIDWAHNCIHITQSKTHYPLDLPLKSSFGNALADYLIEERHTAETDLVFMRVNAPWVGLRNINQIIRKVISQAGIDLFERPCGARLLRRNLATATLKKGLALSVISAQLGHQSEDSTMVYLTTDSTTLASLTLPLPGKGSVL